MYQQYAVSSTPVTIHVDRDAEVQILDQAVRFRFDGVAPTATVGYQIAAGGTYRHRGEPVAITFIAETDTAELNLLQR